MFKMLLLLFLFVSLLAEVAQCSEHKQRSVCNIVPFFKVK